MNDDYIVTYIIKKPNECIKHHVAQRLRPSASVSRVKSIGERTAREMGGKLIKIKIDKWCN